MMISKQVEQELNSGLSRKQVHKKMHGLDEDDEIVYHVNCLCSAKEKKKYLVLNMVLVAILVYVTGRKIYEISQYNLREITAMVMLVVPAVNCYVIRQLLRFHKNGYKFLFVLTVLSLVHKENHYGLGLLTAVLMIVLSGFLYLKLFGKKTMIPYK